MPLSKRKIEPHSHRTQRGALLLFVVSGGFFAWCSYSLCKAGIGFGSAKGFEIPFTLMIQTMYLFVVLILNNSLSPTRLLMTAIATTLLALGFTSM